MELGIVVLNYKKYDLTIKCVNSLISIKNASIVIVDNKSNNNSYETLSEYFHKYKNIYVISTTKNGGYSYGNNFGINFIERELPSIKFISILNPDVEIIDPNIFSSLKNALIENNDFGLVSAFQILNDQLNDKSRGYWNITEGVKSIFDTTYISRMIKPKASDVLKRNNTLFLCVDACVGSLFMMKLETLKKINYLDEKVFLYFEENILGKKLKNVKLKEVIIMNEYYYHNHSHNDAYSNKLSSLKFNLKVTRDSKSYYLKEYQKLNSILVYLGIILDYMNSYIIISFWLIKNMIRRIFK